MNDELKKELGLLPALSLVVGMVIGAGVFFKPTAVFTATGTASLGVLAWIIGGAITIAGGLTVAEIATLIPETGGMIAYLRKTYGEVWGFLLGWAQTTIYFPANIAALGIIFATQAVALMGIQNEAYIKIIAVLLIIFLTAMNSLSSKMGGNIQLVATIAKLVPIFVIIIFGLINNDPRQIEIFPMIGEKGLAAGLGGALVAIMFAYEGWINVGNIAGEMKNPAKDLPKAIIGGIFIVISVYVIINIAYVNMIPASELAKSPTPASDVATKIFGAMGSKIIASGILISIFGGANGFIMTGMRAPFALAQEGKLPFSNWIGELHHRFKTPRNAGILLVVISIAFVMSGNFDQLTDLAVFVIWMFYVMTFFAIFILRRKMKDVERTYKVPLYPIVPAIAILGGLFILIYTLTNQTSNAVMGLLITLLGLPIYLYKTKKQS